MLAHGEGDRTSRAPHLIGDLNAACRCSDHQDTSRRQAGRRGVVEGCQRLDLSGQGGSEGRKSGNVEAARGDDHGGARNGAPVCGHLVAVRGGRHRFDVRVRHERRADETRVTFQEGDDTCHVHVAVRIITVIGQARQTGQPVRREKPERLPASGTPGLAHLAALDDHVVDSERGEAVTCRKTGMTGAYDDSGRAHGAFRSPRR